MESMIERIAIGQAKFDEREWLAMPRGERERYSQRARLAIEAMLEPTEAMKDAASAVGPDTNSGGFDWDDAVDVWQAMISTAALEAKP